MRRLSFSTPFFVLCALACLVSAPAATLPASDPESARQAVRAAKPGDVILLQDGEWNDADLRLAGQGRPGEPITIRATTPGRVILTGASRLRLGGSHLVVSGLHFKNLSGTKADWLEFRIDSKQLASHCRVTDCAFTEDADFQSAEKENRWVGLYGESNELDHCRIEGKKNKGATVVIWLGAGGQGRHRVHHNFFGERPRLGQNGGETLRVGDSDTSLMEAKCVVADNWFYRCDGETECISNKSCGNLYERNVFEEVQGTLTLRHGNGCVVRENLFWGNRRKRTGGIRLIGEDHQVLDNHLQDLAGDGFRSAITLVNGQVNAPLNGYAPVKNAVIRGNTLLNCAHNLLLGYNDEEEAQVLPEGILLSGNRVVTGSKEGMIEGDLAVGGVRWEGNEFCGPQLGVSPAPGIRVVSDGKLASRKLPSRAGYGPGW